MLSKKITNLFPSQQERSIHVLPPIKQSPFTDLHQFLQNIDFYNNPRLINPYSVCKKSTDFYKLAFFFLGFLFLGLALIAFLKTPNWIWHHLVWDAPLLKHLVVILSLMLSGSAFMIGWNLSPEREAIKWITHQGKRKLAKKYYTKRSQLRLIDFIPLGKDYQKKNFLKHSYIESLEKIDLLKEEYYVILHRITTTPGLCKEDKEKLLNQASLKFNDAVDRIVRFMLSQNA